MPLKAIIFDFDDTLSDEMGSFAIAVRNAGQAASDRHGIEPERLVESVMAFALEEWRRSDLRSIGRSRGIGFSEVFSGGFVEKEIADVLGPEGERLRPVVWRRALATAGVEDEPLVAAMSAASLEQGTGPHEPYPGTLELVKTLHGAMPLGMVTNGHHDIQRRKVRRSGLEPFFTSIVIPGEHGPEKPKPDAAPFCRALDELGVSPQDTVMVGNDPVNDIYGAACLGMRTVWVNRTGDRFPAETPPDHEITDLRELPAVLGL